MNFCSSCKAPLKANANFCAACGHRVEGPSPATSPAAPPSAPPAAAGTAQVVKLSRFPDPSDASLLASLAAIGIQVDRREVLGFCAALATGIVFPRVMPYLLPVLHPILVKVPWSSFGTTIEAFNTFCVTFMTFLLSFIVAFFTFDKKRK